MQLLHGFQLKPISATIESGVIVTAYKPNGTYQQRRGQPRPYTQQHNELAAKGYVFCKWVTHHNMLMVKPSKDLLAEFERCIGYKITAVMPNSNINPEVFGIRVSDESRITSAIVSTVKKEDFQELVDTSPIYFDAYAK